MSSIILAGTEEVLTTDSGLGVLKADEAERRPALRSFSVGWAISEGENFTLLKLLMKKIYCSFLINKRRYKPNNCPRNGTTPRITG